MDNPKGIAVNRDYRLDLLKAIAIVTVLIWHLHPFQLYYNSDQPSANSFAFIMTKGLLKGFNLQLTLLGVPIFFIVALYLFMGNAERPGYFKKRVTRLTKTFIFWSAVQLAVYLVLKIMVHLHLFELTFQEFSVLDLIRFGGPSLPIVGDSVFYFLFDLLFLTIVAYIYLLMNNKLKVISSYLIIVCSLVYFELYFFLGKFIPYWSLSNFIIYIPVAFLLRNHQKFFRLKYYCLLGFIVFSAQDILFGVTRLGILYDVSVNTYARISVFLGTVTIFFLVWTGWFSNISRYVQFLSFNVLGIFALHKYWQLFYSLLLPNVFSLFNVSELLSFSQFTLLLGLVSFFVTIASTLISVYALGLTPAKKYVT